MSLDKGYAYHYIGPTDTNDDLLIRIHNYSFITKGNHEYIVQVDEYKHKVYCVKFYDKNDFGDKNKFKVLKGSSTKEDFRDFFGIIATCISICQHIYHGDTDKGHTPSFIFIGGNSVDEDPINSKRYRLYKLIIANKVSKTNFIHSETESLNMCILLNINLKRKPYEYNAVIQKLGEVGVDIDNLTLVDSEDILQEATVLYRRKRF